MRIIFLGTPEFAVPALEKLLSWGEAEVVGLVCQPDRPSGRGQKLFAPPTKLIAQARNIPVFQPERLSRSPETVESMRALQPDVLVTAAFGQILKKSVLEMAPWGVVNVHGSLLPKYRGAAPVNWAIINGETETGITTMLSDAGIDTGKMLLKQPVPIEEDTDAEQLGHTLSHVGADLLIKTLSGLKAGTIEPETQDDAQASYAPMLKKEMGLIDWQKPAQDVHNLVRGLYGWPGTTTMINGAVLKVIKTRVAKDVNCSHAHAGEIVSVSPVVIIACGADEKTALELIEVQPANKQKMPARSWINGARIAAGMFLGTEKQ